MKASKKLIPAIAMLLVSAVVLTSASYAWFTMSKDVQANNMKLTVTAPTNLMISQAPNTGYDTHTDFADPVDDTKLYPSSSYYGDVFTATRTNDNDGNPTANTTYYPGTVGNLTYTDMTFYKDYVVYMKTVGDKDVTVAIDPSATVTNITGTGAEEAYKAVRCAVVAQQAIGTKDTATAADWLTTTYAADTTNTSTEKFAAATGNVINGNNVIATDKSTSATGFLQTREATPSTILGPMKYDGADWTDYLGAGDDDNIADDATDAIITVEAGEKVTAVLIRVWFEGQSDWTYSGIANQTVEVNLGFTTVAETAPVVGP